MLIKSIVLCSFLSLFLSQTTLADIQAVKFPATFMSLEGDNAKVKLATGKILTVPSLSLLPNKNLKSQQPIMVRLARKDLGLVFKKRTDLIKE